MKQSEPAFNRDSPEIVATVMVDGKSIKLRGSPEFNAFIDSVMRLDPEPMFRQAVWLEEMSHFLAAGVRGDEKDMHIWGRTIVPAATHEARMFLETLYDLADIPRRAAALLLQTFAKRFFEIATEQDPSLVPDKR
jgi:hypothetical protein